MAATPDDSLLAPARAIVGFIENRDRALLDGVFADEPVLLESVAPYVFEGRGAVTRWAEALARHVDDHVDLRATIGEPQEFSQDGDIAFFSLPVTWRFAIGRQTVEELGAMALLLRREGDRWLVIRYAWAVSLSSPSEP